MPKLNMTARWVQGVVATGKQVDYFDTHLSGLMLRVSAKGGKTWCVKYRHGDRQRRLTLGQYPALSLADESSEKLQRGLGKLCLTSSSGAVML